MTPNQARVLLKLDPEFTQEDLKVAFRRAARFFHPDYNPSPAAPRAFQLIVEAAAVLAPLARPS